MQTPAFCEAPLPSEQEAAWLQVLEEDAQTSPVADVHVPEAPQTQGAELAVAPSPWTQAGPVKAAHRQASELWSQERVEAVSVLKCSSPPLLPPLKSKHPRGWFDDEVVDAPVSDQPTCLAAASHVAASAIRPYPLSAHVPEVTTRYTVCCVCDRPPGSAPANATAANRNPAAGSRWHLEN